MTKCKLPRELDAPIEQCGTAKGLTLCVGDRVIRKNFKEGKKSFTFKHKGTVIGVQMGRANNGRKELGARVCFDNDDPGELAYRYLFSELKTVK
jgi:hypothetical protein